MLIFLPKETKNVLLTLEHLKQLKHLINFKTCSIHTHLAVNQLTFINIYCSVTMLHRESLQIIYLKKNLLHTIRIKGRTIFYFQLFSCKNFTLFCSCFCACTDFIKCLIMPFMYGRFVQYLHKRLFIIVH